MNLVLNNFIPRDKIEVDDGKPVVVDGYERTPVADWAKAKLQQDAPYLLKQQAPQGGGAPAGRSSAKEIPVGTKNPFAPDSFNLTEQARIFRTDINKYNMLKNAVSG